mmetsp:Transcript_23092/g.35140  ORF Transcript_23092/g.35140 Transcript_23092/m.35140 type:complete len:200 (-) Transcript_23092:217-816(-)
MRILGAILEIRHLQGMGRERDMCILVAILVDFNDVENNTRLEEPDFSGLALDVESRYGGTFMHISGAISFYGDVWRTMDIMTPYSIFIDSFDRVERYGNMFVAKNHQRLSFRFLCSILRKSEASRIRMFKVLFLTIPAVVHQCCQLPFYLPFSSTISQSEKPRHNLQRIEILRGSTARPSSQPTGELAIAILLVRILRK